MRHNIKIAMCLAGLVLALSSGLASAEFGNRFYVGVGGGMSMIEPDPNESGYVNDSSSDSGVKGYIGWDFAERLGAELYYAALGEATMKQGEGQSLTPPDGAVTYNAMGASLLYHVYNSQGLDGRLDRTGLSAFLKGGVGTLDTESDTLSIEPLEDAHLMLGAGIEYGFRSGLAIRGEFEAFDTDAQLASLGLLWRFGGGGGYETAPLPLPTEKPAEPELAIDTAPADFDEDGVPNTTDACPGSPAGVVVNDEGCPLFDLALQGVNFASGSSELTPDSLAVLDRVASDLLRYPDVRVAVAAHTDNQGDANANLELSKQRALSVARYLVSRGIGASRLRPEAYGESSPLVSNATPEGRAQNRRVELRTLD